MRVGQAAAAALRASGLPCEGVNLFLADGEAAMAVLAQKLSIIEGVRT